MDELDEIRGKRFQFGKNWTNYVESIDDTNIEYARTSLEEILECSDLSGKKFLDIGCGSGIFSLAARMLGAEVLSFDYDPVSVQCTSEVKERFFKKDTSWRIIRGSVLDTSFISSLGNFDIVYAWGVLHHTGDLHRSLDNAVVPVGNDGTLVVAIYNDQGGRSIFWKALKKGYSSHLLWKVLISSVFIPLFFIKTVGKGLVQYGNPIKEFRVYKKNRGMSVYYDWVDWLGGYPFETARPDEIQAVYEEKGFKLQKIKKTKRLGCNEFVFRKSKRES